MRAIQSNCDELGGPGVVHFWCNSSSIFFFMFFFLCLVTEPEPMTEVDLREASSAIDVFGYPLVRFLILKVAFGKQRKRK